MSNYELSHRIPHFQCALPLPFTEHLRLRHQSSLSGRLCKGLCQIKVIQ